MDSVNSVSDNLLLTIHLFFHKVLSTRWYVLGLDKLNKVSKLYVGPPFPHLVRRTLADI